MCELGVGWVKAKGACVSVRRRAGAGTRLQMSALVLAAGTVSSPKSTLPHGVARAHNHVHSHNSASPSKLRTGLIAGAALLGAYSILLGLLESSDACRGTPLVIFAVGSGLVVLSFAAILCAGLYVDLRPWQQRIGLAQRILLGLFVFFALLGIVGHFQNSGCDEASPGFFKRTDWLLSLYAPVLYLAGLAMLVVRLGGGASETHVRSLDDLDDGSSGCA